MCGARERADLWGPVPDPLVTRPPRRCRESHREARRASLWWRGFGLALLFAAGCLSEASALDELYVPSAHNIRAYSRTASGNVAPLRTIDGPATVLAFPAGLAVDLVNDEIVVANFGGDSITVYRRRASGNVAPLRRVVGPVTGLSGPVGLAVDLVNNEIVVPNESNNSITVYSRTASGDVAPLRTISGPTTGLNKPFGVAVDTVNDEIVVVNFFAQSITVYSRTASGDVAPLRTISGPATGLKLPTDVAVDLVNNEIIVTGGVTNASTITVYSRTASGDVAPLRTISGPATGLSDATGVAVDTVNDEIIVANSIFLGLSSINVYSRTANGNVAPLRTLQGPATGLGSGLGGPASVAVTPTSVPLASVVLNKVAFGPGRTITYQATLTPGLSPTLVDIYLGCLLPDGVTFVSLVQSSPGVISPSAGPLPVPFQATVLLPPMVIVQFSYQFAGFEPPGTYFTYAGLAVAGSNPLIPSSQISVAIRPFQFTP